jgi:hypothetical protein
MLNLYFPLWGATFDSEGVGSLGRGVAIYVPSADEWRTIQKTDVWMAQWRSEGGRPEGPTPPCCVVVLSALGDTDSIYDAIAEVGQRLLSMANDAVTALRLYRPGWFLQPQQTLYIFHAPSLPVNIVRAPGPYRQVFASDPAGAPMARFELKLADLTQRLEAPGPIAATWELLATYRGTDGNSSVEIAIESFNRSYGFQLRPSSRAANLFTALDGMLGGMSARRIGHLSVDARGFRRRVEIALRTAAYGDDPRNAAKWLDTVARGLRNQIAHSSGTAVEGQAQEAYEHLQAIVRALLRQYIRFFPRWAGASAEKAERLGIAGDSPLAAAYVKALEAEARQPGSMSDLLRA